MIKVDKVECKDGRVYYVYNSNNGYNKKNICINGKVQTVPKDKYEKYLPKLSEIKKLDTLYMSNKNQLYKEVVCASSGNTSNKDKKVRININNEVVSYLPKKANNLAILLTPDNCDMVSRVEPSILVERLSKRTVIISRNGGGGNVRRIGSACCGDVLTLAYKYTNGKQQVSINVLSVKDFYQYELGGLFL
ncbi:hypothetical protein LP048_161 [Listeria phage LP-048]|uniref:Uncharacterized protein n=2 Tax=Pecentumvirus LP048 TaxID=2560557 RepID=A0A5C2IG91_9CAUD|nr:hypothetical protein LP048_161 [Listeria phage LP-048]AHL19834.1 hypothetical protein LP048_161 [Listeria phage LP-048]QEP53159.2 hypothetical protein FK485_0159 [Listeria phage LP-039]